MFKIFILGKKNLNQNDVELDFSKGHAFVLFYFFGIIKKMYSGLCTSPRTPQNSYISLYFGPLPKTSGTIYALVYHSIYFYNKFNYIYDDTTHDTKKYG